MIGGVSANIDTVRAGLDAYKRGDLDSVRELLAPDVRWEGVDGETCSNREETLETLRANSARAADLELADAVPFGTDRVMVCLVRVGGDGGGEEDGQSRLYNVVTFAGEKISRLQGFVARKDAVQAARGGDADPAGKAKAKVENKRKRPLKRRVRMAIGRALGR
jgi:ketosteroid isomerase-like protein